MSFITVSRGSNSGGRELAVGLADKLGFQYVSREQLADEARECGIAVDELEKAISQPPLKVYELRQERLAYLCCARIHLCDRLAESSLVYDGHAGHMLLSGVPNILRVRVVADMEYRVHVVMHERGVSRREARSYIIGVDMERDRWSRFLYHVDWRDLFYYDVLVNISQTGLNHACDLLMQTAGQAMFQFTEETRDALKNIRLASRAQYELLRTDATRQGEFMVTANNGEIYLVGRASQAELMPDAVSVVESLDNVRSVCSSVADSHVLFLQDRFSRDAATLRDIERAADRLDASVQLMQLSGPDAVPGAEFFDASTSHEEEPGIEVHDVVHPETVDTEVLQSGDDIAACSRGLETAGRSAGVVTFFGTADWLLSHLEARQEFNMIVLGDLFIGRPAAVRARLKEQLARRFANRLKIPVLTAEEISHKVRFAALDAAKLVLSVAAAIGILTVLWLKQGMWAELALRHDAAGWAVLGVIALLGITLAFAFIYGSAVKLILRLVRFE